LEPALNTLFIDIEGTLIHEPDPQAVAPHQLHGHLLLAQMRDVAVSTGLMDASQATAHIEGFFKTQLWWDWHGFLDCLGLDPAMFWSFADDRSASFLPPVEKGLQAKLKQLHTAGMRLCITSNNPTSGIHHKLRLAGLAPLWQEEHFDRLLGTNLMRSMKWDRVFWDTALKQANVDPKDVVVIGDTWHDDVVTPQDAGIRRFIFMDRGQANDLTPRGEVEICRVQNWTQVTKALLGPAPDKAFIHNIKQYRNSKATT